MRRLTSGLALSLWATATAAQPFPSYRTPNGADVPSAVLLCIDAVNPGKAVACAAAPTGAVTFAQQANTNMTYAIVAVGIASTAVLVAAPVSRQSLDLWNVSGHPTGVATDIWCAFGVAAVVAQGFPVYGNGTNVSRNLPAAIDGRALNCIAATATALTIGVAQQ